MALLSVRIDEYGIMYTGTSRAYFENQMTKALEKAHQVKTVMKLYEYDHAFISKEGVEYFTKPFGFVGTTYIAKANLQDFKGLSLFDKDGNPISEMEGQDASIVATEIAKQVGVKFQPMHGRGSQLRVACSAILEHLTKKAPSPENA